jgi:hypothetical protein
MLDYILMGVAARSARAAVGPLASTPSEIMSFGTFVVPRPCGNATSARLFPLHGHETTHASLAGVWVDEDGGTMYRLWLVLLIGCLLAVPRGAMAQCDEACEHLSNPDGSHRGYACVRGTQGTDCDAHASSCVITTTGCNDQFAANDDLSVLLSDPTGRVFAVAEICSRDHHVLLTTRVAAAADARYDADVAREDSEVAGRVLATSALAAHQATGSRR